MGNLYDYEQMMIEREHEIEERQAHRALLSQLHAGPPAASVRGRLPIRARFGLYLIRLGARLAA